MANEITTTSHNDITNASLTLPFIIRALTESPDIWFWAKQFDLTAGHASPVLSLPVENSFWGSAADDGAGVDTELDATQGTDLSNTAATTGAVTCTPGEYGVAMEITDNVQEDSVAAIDVFGWIQSRLVFAIQLAMADDFAALFASLSTSVGSSGVNLSIANMVAAFQGIRTSGANADAMVGILDNVQANDLEDALVSTNAAAAVFALSADRLIGYMPGTGPGSVNPGRQVMTFRGAPIFNTGLTDTANAAADVVGAVFCPSTAWNDNSGATTFGMAWKRLPRIETDRIVLGRSTQLVATARAGFCEMQDLSGRAVITDA